MTLQADQWAFRILQSNASRAGSLRAMRDVEVAVVGDDVWIKGCNLDDGLLSTLSAIADGPVFALADKCVLTPIGQLVPTCRLPDAEFMSAGDFFQPVLPTAKMPRRTVDRMALSLSRCADEHPAELWRGSAVVFRAWVETAPEIRLRALRYAVSAATEAEVLVRGNPLPPLPGCSYWLSGQVALPLGWHWSPRIDSAAMNEVILQSVNDASASTLVVWNHSNDDLSVGHLEVTARTSFVPATRSSVRRIR